MVETSPTIGHLQQIVESTGVAAVDDFWRRAIATGTPLIDPVSDDACQVTFLWRGEARTTTVAWGVELELERMLGTDLWHATTTLPADLRTLYYLTHDGHTEIPLDPVRGPTHADPLNHRRLRFPRDPGDTSDADRWVSILELPHAPAEPWLSPPAAGTQGRTIDAELDSRSLARRCRVGVHLPAQGVTAGAPVLIVFDGHDARTVLGVPTTVDNLVAAGRIPPIVCLLVYSPGDIRNDELTPESGMAQFVADELLPWARERWAVTDDPQWTVVAGVSLGGLTAAHLGRHRPDAVGAVIAQSGSFWWPKPDQGEPEWLTREYATRPAARLRFYLDVGNREDRPGPGGAPSQITANRRFRDTLLAGGYPARYVEFAGAHDYINWRRTFADGLLAVLGG
jgi:enterochelin esterase family protein